MRFEITVSGKAGRPKNVYMLNEQQATLLMTFLKNTDIVADFKTELVRQFYLMRSELQKREALRVQMKPIRRELTDVIKEVTDDRWMYKHFTDLAYKTVTGRNSAQLRKERNAPSNATAIDYMTSDEIEAITALESKFSVLLEMGMGYHEVKEMLLKRESVRRS